MKKAVNSINIDLNGPDVSDLIVHNGIHDYKNLSSGISGNTLRDVLSKKRFICLEFLQKDGYYITYNEELDTLIFVSTRLELRDDKLKWIEVERGFVQKDMKLIKRIEFNEKIDICGQTYVENLDIPFDFSITKVLPVGAKRAAMEYFGGYLFSYKKGTENHTKNYYRDFGGFNAPFIEKFNNSRSICNAMETLEESYFDDNLIVTSGVFAVQSDNASAYQLSKRHIRIPDCALKNMKNFAKQWVKENRLLTKEENNLNISILQKVDGIMIQRIFNPVYFCCPELDDIEIEMCEYARICYRESVDIGIKTLAKTYLVWKGSTKGTVFEKTSKFVDEAARLRSTENCLNFMKYYSEYGFMDMFCVYVSAVMGTDPIVEMLYNMNCKNEKNMKQFQAIMLSNICQYGDGIDTMFKNIDRSKKTLNTILGIPKGFMEEMIDNGGYDISPDIVFSVFTDAKGGREYFSRMNKDDIRYFLKNVFHGESSDAWTYSGMFRAMALMTYIYGVKNWKKYLDFLLFYPKKDAESYYSYLLELKELYRKGFIGDEIKKIPWNISGKKLLDENKKVHIMHFSCCENHKEISEKYKKNEEKWKQYVFDSDELEIRYPIKPEDMIKEALELNNCLEQFIEKVADGKTTILFIRKKSSAEKSFFTLEIKGKSIRQCHGFNNCKMSGKVEQFVKKFCMEKGIIFNKGDELLGAQ